MHLDLPIQYQTDSAYFLTSENNTYITRWTMDEINYGDFYDLETIPLNLTVGSHSFSYTTWYDLDNYQKCYLGATTVSGSYEVAGNTWDFEGLTFYMTDYYCYFAFATTQELTATVYQNGSEIESSLAENLLATWLKGTSPGSFYNITIVIGSGDDSLTLTYGYKVLGAYTDNVVYNPNWNVDCYTGESINIEFTNYEGNIRSQYKYFAEGMEILGKLLQKEA